MSAGAQRYAATSVHPHHKLAVLVDLNDSARLAPCLCGLVLNPNTGSWLQTASPTTLASVLLLYVFVVLCHPNFPLFQSLLLPGIQLVVLPGHGDAILQLSACCHLHWGLVHFPQRRVEVLE